ncbi:MAG: hypothetical protein QXJ62_05090 [Nitrososphaeria archaeon]
MELKHLKVTITKGEAGYALLATKLLIKHAAEPTKPLAMIKISERCHYLCSLSVIGSLSNFEHVSKPPFCSLIAY